jgi:hypothetical protein
MLYISLENCIGKGLIRLHKRDSALPVIRRKHTQTQGVSIAESLLLISTDNISCRSWRIPITIPYLWAGQFNFTIGVYIVSRKI